MATKDQIKTDPKFEYFLDNRKNGELAEQTISRYTRELFLYSESTGMTPSELIAQARQEQVDKPWIDDRQLPYHLKKFTKFMEGRKYAPLRIQNALGIVRTFYKSFQINLPETGYKAEASDFHVEVDDLPGFNDIRTAMSLSNTKWRGIISLMASSSMNMIDVRHLTVADFLKAIAEIPKNDAFHIPLRSNIGEDKIAVWKRIRHKSGVPYLTFSSPESVHFILDYLLEHPPDSPDDYLFRSRNGTQLFSSTFQHYFQKINEKAGWEKAGYTNYFTTKTLRKYFANTLEELEVPHRYIRIMMGQKQELVTQSYFKSNMKALLKAYKKSLKNLTFLEKVNVVEKEGEISKSDYMILQNRIKLLERELIHKEDVSRQQE
jgi:integrase